jgi:hypothetical protein
MLTFDVVGASGKDAAPALLTRAAPSSAAPEPPMKFRRETIYLPSELEDDAGCVEGPD